MPVAIRAEGLGKRYRLGERQPYGSLRDSMMRALRAPVRFGRRARSGRGGDAARDSVWALDDVSFEIEEGEVVGIIGKNGSGKSTLLKILSRITEPTRGWAEVRGRVGSLLEVGTGFHPELTGRENVYVNGAILGMKRREIAQQFDEIVAFADVERFIDTPVKFYSSGMQMRLAFAVAAHLETELLLIDEVLAVGDAQFQRKCLDAMKTVSREGRTVLFVSHNMAAVQSLCSRALWVNQGALLQDGGTRAVVLRYLHESCDTRFEVMWSDRSTAPGNEAVRLHAIRVVRDNASADKPLRITDTFGLEFLYWNERPDVRLNLSINIFNQEGVCVFGTTTEHEPAWHGRSFPRGLFRSVCHVPGDVLNEGTYRVTLYVVQDSAIAVYTHEDVFAFDVHDAPERRKDWYGKWPGTVRLNLRWTTEMVAGREG
jgi:lipopolysaccharide transport system ATP-binding protein